MRISEHKFSKVFSTSSRYLYNTSKLRQYIISQTSKSYFQNYLHHPLTIDPFSRLHFFPPFFHNPLPISNERKQSLRIHSIYNSIRTESRSLNLRNTFETAKLFEVTFICLTLEFSSNFQRKTPIFINSFSYYLNFHWNTNQHNGIFLISPNFIKL